MPRIQRSTVNLVRNLALLSAAIAVSPTAVRELRVYLGEDAFADLKRPASDEPVGIRLEDVRFRQFSDRKLVTYAHADRIDVSRDRRKMKLYGVQDGLYRDGDRVFRYRAKNADWDSSWKVLNVTGGVRITNDNLNLRAEGVKFESRKKMLTALGNVTGSVAKGQFAGQHIVYNTETEAFSAGPVSWVGKLPEKLVQDAPDEVKNRKWHFNSASSKMDGKKKPRITYHFDAVATDGEVIVIAAKIEHNQTTDEIIATGNEKNPRVQYFSAKSNMIASRVQVFRKEKRAVFTGNVIMLVKPKKDQNEKPKVEALPAYQPMTPEQVKADRTKVKPKQEMEKTGEDLRSTKNIREFPLVMASAKIEYWYARGSRRAVITGDPQGRQELPEGEWRHVWTNIGYYDGEKETLKLVSTQGRKDTRMKNSIGDDLVATMMLMSTDEEDESFTGNAIEGDFADLGGDDDPRNDPKKPATPPPGGLPGGAPPTTGGGGGGGTGTQDRRRI
jgi:lipopolysaccharide export system protein LptA